MLRAQTEPPGTRDVVARLFTGLKLDILPAKDSDQFQVLRRAGDGSVYSYGQQTPNG